jgi:hypothetical protein
MRENNSQLSLFIKWLLVTTLGWMLNLLVVGGVNVHSQPELQALIASYFFNGVLIGLIVGLGQALILKSQQIPWLKWTFVTVIAYAIGLPASVWLASSFALWNWPAGLPRLTGNPSIFMIVDLHQAALGGVLLGVGQWLILRKHIVLATRRGALLWILGNLCGLGLGGFLATILDSLISLGYFSVPMGHIVARASVGAILGLVTGIILIILHPGLRST